jgi:hypothetical protein
MYVCYYFLMIVYSMIVCMWPRFCSATGETFCYRLGKHRSVIWNCLQSLSLNDTINTDLLWFCMYVCTEYRPSGAALVRLLLRRLFFQPRQRTLRALRWVLLWTVRPEYDIVSPWLLGSSLLVLYCTCSLLLWSICMEYVEWDWLYVVVREIALLV